MAQPIPLELPPRDPRKELLDRLESAPLEHAEALLDVFDLLEELHQAGALQNSAARSAQATRLSSAL